MLARGVDPTESVMGNKQHSLGPFFTCEAISLHLCGPHLLSFLWWMHVPITFSVQ